MATTYYEYDLNGEVIEETDENGNVLVEYTREPDGTLISERRNGVDRFYHYDGAGNTLALTDINGDVTDTFAYNAFGEQTERTGTTPTPYRYHGQQGYYWDEEIGQYHVQRRELDPSQGRWLSADPSGFIDGMNLYIYVHNRAIQFADPSGLQVAGIIPCTPELCGKCLNKAMGPKGEGGDDTVNQLIFFLQKYAKKEPSCNFDINCCKPKSEDARCDPCDVPFAGLRGKLLDPKINKDYKGKSQIILCSKAFVVFTGGAAPPYDKFGECQDVVETIRQELQHLLDRCSKFDEKKDKCESCVCDELRGHYYSGQCKPGSYWWVIKGGRPKPFESVIDCLTWSAANSCLGLCGAKDAEALVGKVKSIYGSCKPSPADEGNPLPPLPAK